MKTRTISSRMKRGLARVIRREHGSSIVELAIVFPILLILFVGTAELGRLFYTYTTLAKATKVGARYLSTSREANSSVAADRNAATLAAQSLVVCGNTNCANQTPIVPGLSPATHVLVTLPAAGPIKHVKVEIQNYTYSPGVFNLAGLTGRPNSTYYFALSPGTQMRYMP